MVAITGTGGRLQTESLVAFSGISIELYRSIKEGYHDFKAIRPYEVTYWTDYAYRSKKDWAGIYQKGAGFKYVDLLAGSESGDTWLWFELKDLGRTKERLRPNAIGVTKDLVSLSKLNKKETINVLDHSEEITNEKRHDEKRVEEEKNLSKNLEKNKINYGIIVAIYPTDIMDNQESWKFPLNKGYSEGVHWRERFHKFIKFMYEEKYREIHKKIPGSQIPPDIKFKSGDVDGLGVTVGVIQISGNDK